MYDPQHFRLEGDVALVRGAGAGIGRAIAQTFAAAGAAVVVTDRTAEGASDVAAGIVASGGRAVALGCDVTRPEQLDAAVAEAVARFGRLTVNNAGGGGPKPFDMPMDDFRWALELNVFSLFRLTQVAAPHMEAAGGGYDPSLDQGRPAPRAAL